MSVTMPCYNDYSIFNQADGIQAIGGTGAVRIGMDFLRSKMGYDTIYVSNPTWGMLNK